MMIVQNNSFECKIFILSLFKILYNQGDREFYVPLMLKFTVTCDFNGTKGNFTVYVGAPEGNHHPLHFQNEWLAKERGGSIPQDVMDSMEKLMEISRTNGVPFEELCEYAIKSANLTSDRNEELESDAEKREEIAESEEASQPERE